MADSKKAIESWPAYILYQITCFLYSILNIHEEEEEKAPETNIALTLVCAFWAFVLCIFVFLFCGKDSITAEARFRLEDFQEQLRQSAECHNYQTNLAFEKFNEDLRGMRAASALRCRNAIAAEACNEVCEAPRDNASDNQDNALPDLDLTPSTSGLQRLSTCSTSQDENDADDREESSDITASDPVEVDLPPTSRSLYPITEAEVEEYSDEGAQGDYCHAPHNEQCYEAVEDNAYGVEPLAEYANEAGSDYGGEACDDYREDYRNESQNVSCDEELPNCNENSEEYQNEAVAEYGNETYDENCNEPSDPYQSYANQTLDYELPSARGQCQGNVVCDSSQHEYRNQTLDYKLPSARGQRQSKLPRESLYRNSSQNEYRNQAHNQALPTISEEHESDRDEYSNGSREAFENQPLDEGPSTSGLQRGAYRSGLREVSANKPRDLFGSKQRGLVGNKQCDASVYKRDTSAYKPRDTAGYEPRGSSGYNPRDRSGNRPRDIFGTKSRDATANKPRTQYGNKQSDDVFPTARGPQRDRNLHRESPIYDSSRHKPAAIDELPSTSGMQNTWNISGGLPMRSQPRNEPQDKSHAEQRYSDDLPSASGFNRDAPLCDTSRDASPNEPLDEELPSTSAQSNVTEALVEWDEAAGYEASADEATGDEAAGDEAAGDEATDDRAEEETETKPFDDADELPSTSGAIVPVEESRFVVIDDERPSTSGFQRRRQVQTCAVSPMPKENDNPLDRSQQPSQRQQARQRNPGRSSSPLLEIDALISPTQRRDINALVRNPTSPNRNAIIDFLDDDDDDMQLPLPRRPLYVSEWDEVRQIAYRMPRVKKKPAKPLWKW
ncbi:hypothetical protein KR093_003299 [Drosophila rubida]|uniref:Uncharacterized protein n=1 Tax=Drosophila rubida TaxID=30044 RepID=A0AAD4K9H9_9MUSC|nr:hypothetical protein KR093_003299 [Drosophila rubida]